MSLFRVYADSSLFYHPHMSKLAITQAQIHEESQNIDSIKADPGSSRDRPFVFLLTFLLPGQK